MEKLSKFQVRNLKNIMKEDLDVINMRITGLMEIAEGADHIHAIGIVRTVTGIREIIDTAYNKLLFKSYQRAIDNGL